MTTQTPRANVAGGLFAALIFLFVFGFFIGLPLMGWVLLVAAFVGLWVATSHQRSVEREQRPMEPDRPWHHSNN